jgi:hypothetical protein
LSGYVSEACCAEQLPEAVGAVHCDALRLVDIVEQTGVAVLVLHSCKSWARVPVPLLQHTLRQRGRQAEGGRQVAGAGAAPETMVASLMKMRGASARSCVMLRRCHWCG